MRERAKVRIPASYRFPPALKERLADAAVKAGRSENAEVVARLEASFTTVGRNGGAAPSPNRPTIPPAGDLTAAKPDPKRGR